LGIGTTDEVFHCCGILPVLIDKLNSSVRPSNRSTGQLTLQYLTTFGIQLRVDFMRVYFMKS